jgi:TetR/AcrR family transcriptional regulator
MSAVPAALATTAVPRRRLSSQDRRQQLIACAIELFSRSGFKGTRTKDIAAACGVSEGILFRHFATKEDLYRAILETHAHDAGKDEWLREMKHCAAARDDQGLVTSLVDHIVRSFREETAFHRLMLYAWLEGHPLAAMAEQQMGMPIFHFLKKYVTQRQRDGVFRAGDPGALVMAMYSPALQFALSKYLFRAPWACGEDGPTAEAFVRFLLAGLRKVEKKVGS